MAVLVSLQHCEHHAEQHGEDEAKLGTGAIIVLQRVVRPSDCGARKKQDQRVDQRQMERVKGLDANWRPVCKTRQAVCV